MMSTQLSSLIRTGEQPYVFVSYSHKDEVWKDELLRQLDHLQDAGNFKIWEDRQIHPGTDWYADIRNTLRRTKIAVCLISSNFLRSSFCINEEIAYLLQAQNRGDLEILPVLVEDCVWKRHRWLSRLQMLPRDGRDIKTHFEDNPAKAFTPVADLIFDMLQPGYYFERPPPEGEPPQIDIERLPETTDLVFGRQEELNALDKIWNDDTLNVAVFKASGGVGKSSLVRAWVEDMALDNYRGAKRVYAWSFYSQGTDKRVTSADEFLSEALDWFGDRTKGEGLSPWSRGQRLADLVRKERTLLLLDGLEPLQSGQAFDRGKIKDSGLEALLDELGRNNPGLCLISTREEVSDLWHDREACRVGQFDLDTISKTAGRALLRVSGIEGEDAALEQAVEAFGRHAYAIKLLGHFLTWCGTPNIGHATDIRDLPDIEATDGKHPRRVMAAFAERFGESAKADILAMLGLFDRPADEGCIAALRAEPAIAGLNAAVLPISETVWDQHVDELRKLGLLTPESHYAPDELDAHPLVREHFGAQLRAEREQAWKAGHERLYEHLKTVPDEHQPNTLAEMAPLFQAVHHGCQAGRRQEVLYEVYHDRIVRRDEEYLVKKLGAFGADLGLVASFFDPPFAHPADDLREDARAWLLNGAAFRLRALGRLGEAVAPMRAAIEQHSRQENWLEAGRSASNLSELQLATGEVAAAVASGGAAIEHADRSGDAFIRMVNRATLADAKHQTGDTAAAQTLFEAAEVIQEEDRPNSPRLFSLRGYQYCDLLLTLGQAEGVRERAAYALELSTKFLGKGLGLLEIALDHLSLGRAALALGEWDEAGARLDQAVDGLRASGNMDDLPRGLLARAVFFREVATSAREEAATAYASSRRDLDEVMRLAKRCGLRLFECDAHLEYARLTLKEGGDRAVARGHLEDAEALVAACGYHRRDAEVAALKKDLGL